jgi:hypothetical protein
MNTHIGIHQESASTLTMLYIGGFILLLSLICYWYASKLKKDNTSYLKKEQKAALKQKSKKMKVAGHLLLSASILVIIIHLASSIGGNYDIKKLNFNVPIEVSDDQYYGADHTDSPVQYKMKIPTSGTHSPHDLKFGFYTEKPAYEKLVHNLEHGDIIIYYRANADSDQVMQLKYFSKFKLAGAGILAVPNDDIPEGKEIVVTAWTKTMELTTFDEQKIGTFIYNYINKGPEQIPASIRRGGGTM